MAQAPTLTDGTVTIRPHRPGDVRGVLEQSQDPLSQQWTTIPVPYSLADAEVFVGRINPRGWEQDTEWGFAVEADGRFSGTISLRSEGHGRAALAYGSHPWVRGTGLVERAVRLLLDWGFDQQSLETVVWRADVGNWPSRRLAWRLGFSFDGKVRRWLPHRGELRDAWVGTLLRDEAREPRSAWLDCPVLELDGLRLRPIHHRDAERIAEACADERTQRWLGHLPTPYTLADAHAYVETRSEQRADGSGVTWAVVDPADDLILATVGFFGLQPGVECEVGYWTHPEARGRGLMTRATGRVVGYAFETLGVERVTAFAAVGNAASRHVIEANGMTLYGVERRGIETGEGRADMALYDVLAEEFASRRCATADHSSTAMPATDSAAPTSEVDR
jgi:RimJ/RimL family protein N-acetyltransferase